MHFTENHLWVFSSALYAKPHIADCFLQLQDRYKANVNVLLWSIWLERQQVRLTSDRLAAALELIQQWDVDYVQVLRELRRKIKSRLDFAQNLGFIVSVREKIKQAELLAEKQEQEWLEQVAQDWSWESVQLKEGENLGLYLHFLNIPQMFIEEVKAIVNNHEN